MQNVNTGNSSARAAMSNFILTTDERLKDNADYRKVCNIVHRLMEGGVTFAAKGYCISMSDVIYTMLTQVGIQCRIVECGLSINDKVNDSLFVVGYDNLKDTEYSSDTHVVVITQTEIPMIIDVSISHLLPRNLQGVIDSCSADGTIIMANISSDIVDLTYKEKKHFSIPMLHQTSIVDRIKTDMLTLKSIKLLKALVAVALIISALNGIRGFYDFYSVYIDDSNNWGPYAMQRLDDKLNKLIIQLDEKK